MNVPFFDTSTDWSGSYATDTGGTSPPRGGVILENVRHDGHNFARELRLVGIRLKVEEVTPSGSVTSTRSIFLELANPPFAVGTIRVLTPTPFEPLPGVPYATVRLLREAGEVPQFRTYFSDGTNHVAYGIAADFHLPDDWFTSELPNCEVRHLWLDQRYLFSRLANSPPHEPSGALQAARCHPIVKYAFTANAAVDRSRNRMRIASIRFDYRLELRLDRHYALSTNATLSQLGQSAGLFKDRETAFGIRPTGVAFAAVEKPLVLEVWTHGLWEGTPIVGPRTGTPGDGNRSWDNVHWWGAQASGDPIIQAPGGAHAAHIHWRWGGAGEKIPFARDSYPEIDRSGVPTTVSARDWGGGALRVLVDPDIWIQTIRIAVVRNAPSLNPRTSGVTLESLSRERWETLFDPDLRPKPSDIFSGANIVFWYSAEVHASTQFPAETEWSTFPWRTTTTHPGATVASPANGGSVFIHGIFFAHGPPLGISVSVGSKKPEHWPRDVAALRASPTWNRPAN